MSQAQRVTKRETDDLKSDPSRESVEIAEAIKALQVQLADLRKIVRAAKTSGEEIKPGRRQ